MQILTKNQAKYNKATGRGYLNAGITLSPSTESVEFGGRDTCVKSGACGPLCLRYAGMNQMTTHKAARVKRTLLWINHPNAFIDLASSEIDALLRKAERKAMTAAIRPNGLSDEAKMAIRLAKRYPDVQFYDYTKLPKPWTRTLPNYHLTFSLDIGNEQDALDALDHGINVAVVFDLGKGDPMPSTWTLNGRTLPVIDGDVDDLRFLDPVGVFVGLRGKTITGGRQKGVDAGFYRSPDA